jgi:predicted HicB family RNase H-like nuclease
MNVMTYKGFAARVEFDENDGVFVGRLAEMKDVIGFHADSASDLEGAFHEAVDDYIATCALVGRRGER